MCQILSGQYQTSYLTELGTVWLKCPTIFAILTWPCIFYDLFQSILNCLNRKTFNYVEACKTIYTSSTLRKMPSSGSMESCSYLKNSKRKWNKMVYIYDWRNLDINIYCLWNSLEKCSKHLFLPNTWSPLWPMSSSLLLLSWCFSCHAV